MDNPRETYVATLDGSFAGFVVVNMMGALSGYIQTIAVKPEWRSRGVGARLIAVAEERIFRERPNAFLFVSSFNERAQKFYTRLGYQRAGELPDYFLAGYSEILMRKTIGPLRDFVARG